MSRRFIAGYAVAVAIAAMTFGLAVAYRVAVASTERVRLPVRHVFRSGCCRSGLAPAHQPETADALRARPRREDRRHPVCESARFAALTALQQQDSLGVAPTIRPGPTCRSAPTSWSAMRPSVRW